MELVYITHGNVLNVHYLSALPSWIVVIGGVYGAIRLVVDIRHYLSVSREDRPAPPS